ncbi:MAG: peptide ABC transporter ATP-binding protein [Devosia sp. 67-54]|uniref:ABC transporter ATP-binding protein n=1 Tax=unclassified Devosia TaxID=196773 RepID=UPI0009644584|nr:MULTISPECIES: oligopeptide/dipeptide ABC transporter ATP-binding protein [unclassified Devosia]MBN9306516.1 ATP-binding cassette domain-containing protein [Devosia sp.]OJX14629.1 MAG: peptide ABC transporter ATP-binding protein [Devosia sp. 67-54]
MSDLLTVEHLSVRFPIRSGAVWSKVVGHVTAVDDVSFTIAHGETLGLVGESGSGKTSLGQAVLRGHEPAAGRVTLDIDGRRIAITSMGKTELREARRHMQMIFQDPYASLNPRMTVRDILSEPLIAGAARGERLSRTQIDARVVDIATKCGLSRDQLNRFPHAFSGGQRQRIAIARALVLKPALVVCDEPISSLDVSIQAQVLNLLAELQETLGLTYLFIAHDLAAVAYVCDRVAVMYLGQIVELGTTRQVYYSPKHPYTEALMSAVPEPDPDSTRRPILLAGERPDPAHPPTGCRFNTRCLHATETCRAVMPPLRPLGDGHFAACHYAETLELRGALALGAAATATA